MSDVQKVYEQYWAPVVEKDGEIDVEQIKKELYDFYVLIDTVERHVYPEITGGAMSKATYTPEAVLAEYRRQLEDERGVCRECGEEIQSV